MKKKRERLDVIHDILSTIATHRNSLKPTPLLRFANLSTQNFSEYMAELEQKGLVKLLCDEKGRNFYTLTDKGFLFLNKFDLIKGFLEEFDL